MAVFSVNGHEVTGTGERLHKLELLLTSVSRNVDLDHRIVKHADSVLGQLVDYPSDKLLVSGNCA